jgi:hypothetical protein
LDAAGEESLRGIVHDRQDPVSEEADLSRFTLKARSGNQASTHYLRYAESMLLPTLAQIQNAQKIVYHHMPPTPQYSWHCPQRRKRGQPDVCQCTDRSNLNAEI